VAGEAIHALARGGHERDERVGALLVAEFLGLVRHFLTAKK
jgi:hypothetical protein